MGSERCGGEGWGATLAATLRQLRRSRGLTTVEAAELMGMDRRNYANFEAGKGRLNLTRIVAFARITESDPWALLAAIVMNAPRLALATADNKLLLAFFILLGEFDRQHGEAIRLIDTADAVSAFTEAFRRLGAAVAERQARQSTDWLEEGAARLGLGRPPPDESS